MATPPPLILGQGLRVGDVQVIEVSGATDDPALNGLYETNGLVPPTWTHTVDSNLTIARGASEYEIQSSSVAQFEFTPGDADLAPITGNIIDGTPGVWTLTGGTGPTIPKTFKRPKVPSVITSPPTP